MDSKSIFEEAEQLVNTARFEDYGHPLEFCTRTGRLWAAILGLDEITAEQVAMCLLAMKLSRLCHAYKRDSLVDVAGYAKVIEMIAQQRLKNGTTYLENVDYR